MSINDFLNKIKGQIGIDGTTFLCLCIIVLVGVGSFGLGRLSVSEISNEEKIKLQDTKILSVKEGAGKSVEVESRNENVENISKEKMYVASKNGKLYYSLGCAGAKRIAPKNEVWFASKVEAEKSGFTLSTSCK